MTKVFSFSRLILAGAICLFLSPSLEAKSKNDKNRSNHDDHHDGDHHHDDNRDHHHDRDRDHRGYTRTYYSRGYHGGYYYRYPGYYYVRPTISIGVGTGYGTAYYQDDRPIYKGQQVVEGRAASIEIAVQKKLARLGYYGGELDGDIGPASRRAIARFQRDNDLAATGQIDRNLVAALGLS